MDLKIEGNPGQNNAFDETKIDNLQNYNHTVDTIVNNNYGIGGPTRMSSDFEKLRQEIRKEVRSEIIEELVYYITELPGTKSVEEKLTDGGFSQAKIQEAIRQKELYAKRAEKYSCYPAAQQIFFDLFSNIKNEFYSSIFPLIEEGQPLNTVMQAVRNNIVKPLSKLINENGAFDSHLHLSEDHIYGMIYYLTGMCHLNWRDYDQDLKPET